MGMRIRGWWRCRRRVAGEGVRWGAADGGRRRILRGTVTEEPGKGGVHQDGRRVFERGVLRRPARVSRTNPFPRVRPPFPAMEPPPSVCRFSPAAMAPPSSLCCFSPAAMEPPPSACRSSYALSTTILCPLHPFYRFLPSPYVRYPYACRMFPDPTAPGVTSTHSGTFKSEMLER